MKAIILGTDLLEYNNDVKILEINTNTTIYNEGADILDYNPLFQMLVDNGISDFHFIYTETDSHMPLFEPYRFKKKLQDKCTENNILFHEYVVPKGSVTVPFIEDSPTKFILRQSFDTTALIDDTYCADKFEFFNLMSGSTYVPKTYFSTNGLSMDSLDVLNYSDSSNPNLLIKARTPSYDPLKYPELHTLSDSNQLSTIKNDLDSNYLAQEFIYSNDNLIENRYSIIRSIDIIYGGQLDVLNLGGYRQSTIIPISFTANEMINGTTKLNQKSRIKYITKEIGSGLSINYHTDSESYVLDYTGSLKTVDTLQIGDYIRSIDFVDFNGNHAANFQQGVLDVYGWNSDLPQSNNTLEPVSSSLVGMASGSVDTIYIRITLADGKSWVDGPGCTYYIEESGSLNTRFEKLNKMYVGDKIVITDSNTQQLTTVEVVGLEMEHASKTIYGLDFEPGDLFLVDIGDGDYSVMHNSCWCPWHYCGYYCHSSYCTNGCSFGNSKL